MYQDYVKYIRDDKGGSLPIWILYACYHNYKLQQKSNNGVQGPVGPTGDALETDDSR